MTVQQNVQAAFERAKRDDPVELLGDSYRLIGVNRLTWDLKNYRIGSQKNARDALKAMILRLPNEIIDLGKHLANHGPDRSLLMIVTRETSSEELYTVLEGNRRLTALKLLENPERAQDISSRVMNEFKALKAEYDKDPILDMLCFVVPDRKSSRVWVDLRHLGKQGGRGLMEWGPTEKGRRKKDLSIGAATPHVAVLDYMQSKGMLRSISDSDLKGIASTLDRIFGGRAFKSLGKLKINKDWSVTIEKDREDLTHSLIERIFDDFLRGRKDVTDVYKKKQREEYVSTLMLDLLKESEPQEQPPQADPSESSAPETADDQPQSTSDLGPTEEQARPSETDGSAIEEEDPAQSEDSTSATETDQQEHQSGEEDDSSEKDKTRRPRPDSLKRLTLAPTDRTRTLVIKDHWVNRLYLEMRRLNPADQAACGGVMMRVFLETLAELFLEGKAVKIPNGKDSWSAPGINLNTKIKTILHILDPDGSEPDLDMARKGDEDDKQTHSILNLHKYVHNSKVRPDARELKEIWDRWEPLMLRVCSNLP